MLDASFPVVQCSLAPCTSYHGDSNDDNIEGADHDGEMEALRARLLELTDKSNL